MNPQPARKASTNSAATIRSAFFACLVFSGSAENAGWLARPARRPPSGRVKEFR